MKYLGKGRIITDDLIHLDRGDIIDVYEYEDGDETEDGFPVSLNEGEIYATGHGGPDLYADEVELLGISTGPVKGATQEE